MSEKEKKIDPRIIRTRRDLAGSMCTLMREKSFQQITVQEIAERAIINRATFYAHFMDKYELLTYMVKQSFQEMLDEKISQCGECTRENLRLLTLVTCNFLIGFHDEHSPGKTYDHLPIEREIQALIYELLLGWFHESKAEQVSLTAETLAMVTSSTIFGSTLQWVHSRSNLSAEEITDQIMHLTMNGLKSSLV